MKHFFLSIFYFFWNYKKRKKFQGFEKKLQGALENKAENQIKLIKEINSEINKLYPKSRSKYIPLSLPQRIEIRAKVYSKFGEMMEKLNIHINVNLEFL